MPDRCPVFVAGGGAVRVVPGLRCAYPLRGLQVSSWRNVCREEEPLWEFLVDGPHGLEVGPATVCDGGVPIGDALVHMVDRVSGRVVFACQAEGAFDEGCELVIYKPDQQAEAAA